MYVYFAPRMSEKSRITERELTAIICKNVRVLRSRENYNLSLIVTKVDTSITDLSVVLESTANSQYSPKSCEEYRHEVSAF